MSATINLAKKYSPEIFSKVRALVKEHGGVDAALDYIGPRDKGFEILAQWAGIRKDCTLCCGSTPMADMMDITVCGDWHTVCPRCFEKYAKIRK